MEPIEAIDSDTYTQGGHAYVCMPQCTLSEAIALATRARLHELAVGCNVSFTSTLAHTGRAVAMLVNDDVTITSVR